MVIEEFSRIGLFNFAKMIGLEAKRDMSKSELFDNIIQNNLKEEHQAFVKQNDIDILSESIHKDVFTFAKMLNLKVWKTWPKSRIYNIILQNDKEELLKRFKSARGRNRKPVKITDLSDGKEYIFKTSEGAADFLGLLAPRSILYNNGKIWKNKFTGKSYKISK